ncbi:MAG: hypothetical protein ACI4MT_04310 [Christensenellales bacterium]
MNFIDKEAISLFEARSLGIITGLLIDKKTLKLKYLILDDAAPLNFIKADKIIAATDCIVFKNDLCLTTVSESVKKNCFAIFPTFGITTDGKRIGRLTDLEFDGDSLKTLIFNSPIDAKNILRAGKNYIIVQGATEVKIAKSTPKKIKTVDNRQVFIMDEKPLASVKETNLADKSDDLKPTDSYNDNNSYSAYDNEAENNPLRIITDYHFLLGRIVKTNIFSFSGELIIAANSTVTPEVVEKARRYGKLIELTTCSVS